jgi:hypothetical protein
VTVETPAPPALECALERKRSGLSGLDVLSAKAHSAFGPPEFGFGWLLSADY